MALTRGQLPASFLLCAWTLRAAAFKNPGRPPRIALRAAAGGLGAARPRFSLSAVAVRLFDNVRLFILNRHQSRRTCRPGRRLFPSLRTLENHQARKLRSLRSAAGRASRSPSAPLTIHNLINARLHASLISRTPALRHANALTARKKNHLVALPGACFYALEALRRSGARRSPETCEFQSQVERGTQPGNALAVSAKPCKASLRSNKKIKFGRYSRFAAIRRSGARRSAELCAYPCAEREGISIISQAAKSSSRGLAPPSPLPPPNHPPNPPHPARCVLLAGGLGGIRAPCLAPASHPAKPAGVRLGLRPLPPSRSSPSSINSLRLSLLNNKKLHNERLIWLTR